MSHEYHLDIHTVQQNLLQIIHGLGVGEEVVIMDGERTVARLLGPARSSRHPRVPGSARGKLQILAEDEVHLEDFADYMP
jgi:antitoxin (DNA-binding transcriptional repressor) of toxin-antitoxin stability system